MIQTATATIESQQIAGKYLTFALGDEQYGLEILKVREIVGMLDITPVPRMPQCVKGVVNLRGRIIPVVDLRRTFDMPAGETTSQTCIIVVHTDRVETGLIVDRVLEVRDIAAELVEERPAFSAGTEADFIHGLAKTGNTITILLDLAKVMVWKDIIAMAATTARR